MKYPNLFIPGAPKGGTTALSQWLSAHPNILMSPSKEPHYFCDEHRDRGAATLQDYEALFLDADPIQHRFLGEASVWYLFSDTAVPNILRYSPDARFIVMVRNPLEMAPSLHGQFRFNGSELVAGFSEAWALSEARSHGEEIGVRRSSLPAHFFDYRATCALGWQVERLLKHVDRDRIHVVVFDDLRASPKKVFSGVQAFLGLPDYGLRSFDRVNSAKTRRSFLLHAAALKASALKRRFGIMRQTGLLTGLWRWNVKSVERQVLPRNLRKEMADAFRADVMLLGDILGRDLSHWLEFGDT